MELILIESVAGLGRPGDKVKVKAGFARNYLLPGGKALPVSAEVLRNLDKLKARAEEEERQLIASLTELQGRLQGQRLQLSARATEEGHLFGSVSERDIQDALQAAGWPVPPRAVRLEHHLKDAGEHEVEVHLYGEISATVTVEIVAVDALGNPIEIVPPEEGADEEAAGESQAADEGEGSPGETDATS